MRAVTIIVFFMLASAAGGLLFAPGAIKWTSVIFLVAAVFLAYVIWGGRRRLTTNTARAVPESAGRTTEQPGEATE